MVELVQHRLPAIRSLCRRYGVQRLEAFGSAAATQGFDPNRSDVDFIVSFKSGIDLGPWLAVYLDLQRDLDALLGRPVDLVMDKAIRNPLFRREADKTRHLIYAAQDTEAA